MTDAELQAIRERAEKATPGPWKWKDSRPDDDGECLFLRSSHHERIVLDHWARACPSERGMVSGLSIEVDDREFIAGARSDVPALIAEVDRLRAAVAEEREACAAILDRRAELYKPNYEDCDRARADELQEAAQEIRARARPPANQGGEG